MDRNKYVVQCRKTLGVALRKESVDRNNSKLDTILDKLKSLSARRAWIEMAMLNAIKLLLMVALRKESVDRNIKKQEQAAKEYRRSPQGERG